MSLLRRDDCVSCDGATPVCNCSKGEQCVLTSRTCSQCPAIQCIKGQSSGGSINPGVIAGPVVAVLVLASLALFWWLRKKKRRDLARLEELAARARKAESAGFHLSQPSSPQPSSAHSSARTGSHRSLNPSQLPAPPPSAARRSPLSFPDSGGDYSHNGTTNPDNRYDSGGDPFADSRSASPGGSSVSTRIVTTQYRPSETEQGRLGQSEAARALNAARENLLRPKQANIPARPARLPDLDLRLAPPKTSGGELVIDSRSPGGGTTSRQIRDSYLSGNSSAPSFLSGMSYDVHNDAPKIVTSKQVQIGRLQQAEVVQVGRSELLASGARNDKNLAPFSTTGHSSAREYADSRSQSSTGPGTFGSYNSLDNDPSLRTLTPSSRRTDPPSPPLAHEESLHDLPTDNPTDLRFSMGSLAYRDSFSTMGTGRYLAQHPLSSTTSPFGSNMNLELGAIPPPRQLHTITQPYQTQHPSQSQNQGSRFEPRESMFSTKSYADSLLGTFPMIPPNQSNIPPIPTGTGGLGIPQSTSVNTLDGVASGSPLVRPPKTPQRGGAGTVGGGGVGSRPMTATSMADSFLGSFPFVPPNMDDLAGLPSASLPSAVMETPKR